MSNLSGMGMPMTKLTNRQKHSMPCFKEYAAARPRENLRGVSEAFHSTQEPTIECVKLDY